MTQNNHYTTDPYNYDTLRMPTLQERLDRARREIEENNTKLAWQSIAEMVSNGDWDMNVGKDRIKFKPTWSLFTMPQRPY